MPIIGHLHRVTTERHKCAPVRRLSSERRRKFRQCLLWELCSCKHAIVVMKSRKSSWNTPPDLILSDPLWVLWLIHESIRKKTKKHSKAEKYACLQNIQIQKSNNFYQDFKQKQLKRSFLSYYSTLNLFSDTFLAVNRRRKCVTAFHQEGKGTKVL